MLNKDECVICGTNEDIDLHHVLFEMHYSYRLRTSYPRSFKSALTLPMCRSCHERYHSVVKTGVTDDQACKYALKDDIFVERCKTHGVDVTITDAVRSSYIVQTSHPDLVGSGYFEMCERFGIRDNEFLYQRLIQEIHSPIQRAFEPNKYRTLVEYGNTIETMLKDKYVAYIIKKTRRCISIGGESEGVSRVKRFGYMKTVRKLVTEECCKYRLFKGFAHKKVAFTVATTINKLIDLGYIEKVESDGTTKLPDSQRMKKKGSYIRFYPDKLKELADIINQ